MSNALDIKNLLVRVGLFRLDIPVLEIRRGVITGLIGKNGAGKTTLIKTILDSLPPERGEILFDGIPMAGNEQTVKAKTAVVYDTLIYPQHLTPQRVAALIAPFYQDFDYEKYYRLLERFQIHPYYKLSALSRGMQMRFSIAVAFAQNPEILFLDEPTSGLDPSARDDLLNLLLEFIQDENKTVFFSTHITSDLDKIADYIALINNGTIVFNEVKDELLDKYTLIYLEKNELTEELRNHITGLKENSFGYVGLCSDRSLLQDINGVNGVRTVRPTVEDIMIYQGGSI